MARKAAHIRLFGGCSICDGETGYKQIENTRRGAELLSYFVLCGKPIRDGGIPPHLCLEASQSSIIEAVIKPSFSSQPENLLSKALDELRSSMGEYGTLVPKSSLTMQFPLDGIHLDYLEFCRLIDEAEAADDTAVKIQKLTDAEKMYTGPVADGLVRMNKLPALWLLIERIRVADKFVACLEALATLCMSTQNLAAAARPLSTIVKHEQNRSIIAKQLIDLVDRIEDRKFFGHADGYLTKLSSEKALPSLCRYISLMRARALEGSRLGVDAAMEAYRSMHPTNTDIPDELAREYDTAKRVASDVNASKISMATSHVDIHSSVRPDHVYSIVGINFSSVDVKDRDEVYRNLRTCVLSDAMAKVTVVSGPSGIGKTTLIAKLGAEIENDIKGDGELGIDALIYVSCSSAAKLTLDALFERLLQTVRRREAEEILERTRRFNLDAVDKSSVLLGHLRDKQCVILIDGFETEIDANGEIIEAEVREFLAICVKTPVKLKIVITSTTILNPPSGTTAFVRSIRLESGLPCEYSIELLRAADPDDRSGILSAPEHELRRIAAACSNLPYTLESVVSVLLRDDITVHKLLDNREKFDEIVRNPLTGRYESVHPRDRAVLDALAVLGHPSSAMAISFLLEPAGYEIDEVSATLSRLRQQRLISYSKVTETYSQTGLDRDYLFERISTGDTKPASRQPLQRRQVRWYLYEAELLIRKAYATSEPIRDISAALQMSQRALAIAGTLKDDQLLARCHMLCAEAFNQLQQFREALEQARSAGRHARVAQDFETEAHALFMRVGIEDTGNPDFANLDLMADARALASRTDNVRLQMDLWRSTAQIALRIRGWDVIRKALLEANTKLSAIGDLERIVNTTDPFYISRYKAALKQIEGEAAYGQGRWLDALAALEESKRLFREAKDGLGECAANGWLGLTKCRLGKHSEGLPMVEDALHTERYVLRSREGAAKWLHALGEVWSDNGDPKQALECLWLSERLRAGLSQVSINDTKRAVERVLSSMPPQRADEIAKSFSPVAARYSEFAFEWGLGPFEKNPGNPILTPRGGEWDGYSVYNPTVWTDGSEVIMLYRGEGASYLQAERVSSIGLARSTDGVSFYRHPRAVLHPHKDYEYELLAEDATELKYGCEDPRLVRIEGSYYMTYTAYDGKVARLAIAKSDDLIEWERLGAAISPEEWDKLDSRKWKRDIPRGWSKAGAIVPQRINGKYWMYFGDTCIWVAYSEDLMSWKVVPDPVMKPRPNHFDAQLVEPGTTPIVTKDGIWLGYNGADMSTRYAFGQVLLNTSNPTEVIARSIRPLLEPELDDELTGQVPNVVFCEGLVRFKGKWHLYYGMADSRIGLAVAR